MDVTKWAQISTLCLQIKTHIEMSMRLTMIRTTSGTPDWSTPFPLYTEESPSTLTTPMFVKLINCIWYSAFVRGHYSLTSLPKPVCQGSYDDSEGLHWIYARDHGDRLVGLNATHSYAFNRMSSGGGGQEKSVRKESLETKREQTVEILFLQFCELYLSKAGWKLIWL